MLYDGGFNRATYPEVYKIILDYLNSDLCLEKSTELVQQQVISNPEVQQFLFEQLYDYVKFQDSENLHDKAEYLFLQIVKMDTIQKYIKDNLHEQMVLAFDKEGIIQAGIENGSNYFK